MAEVRSALEEKVVEAVRASRDELFGLTAELVACDTTARTPGMPARDEDKLQRILARAARAPGRRADVWEPEPTGTGNRHVPDDLDFKGRPQLAAQLRGAGGGRSLLLNGHIDAVDVEPREQVEQRSLQGDRARRAALRSRHGRHEGRHRRAVIALETLRAPACASPATSCSARSPTRSRPAPEASPPSPTASRPTPASAPSPRASRPGSPAAARSRRTSPSRARRSRRGAAAALARRRRRQRDREGRARHPGAQRDARRVARPARPAASAALAGRHRPDDRQGRNLGGHLPGERARCAATSCTCPAKLDADGTGKAVEAEIAARHRAPPSPRTRGSPSTRSSCEWRGDVVPAEMPADHPLVTATLDAGAGLGRPGKAGRPRLVARRRDVHAPRRHADVLLRRRRPRHGAHDRRVDRRRRARRRRRRLRARPRCAGAAWCERGRLTGERHARTEGQGRPGHRRVLRPGGGVGAPARRRGLPRDGRRPRRSALARRRRGHRRCGRCGAGRRTGADVGRRASPSSPATCPRSPTAGASSTRPSRASAASTSSSTAPASGSRSRPSR